MKALIITDGTESIQFIAQIIKESLNGGGTNAKIKIKTTICAAENFQGNELLPTDIFFIGCEKSSPSSFKWLEDFLAHINLASRKCGIFSVKAKSISYLKSILKDSEADIGEPLLAETVKKADVKKWIKQFIKG